MNKKFFPTRTFTIKTQLTPKELADKLLKNHMTNELFEVGLNSDKNNVISFDVDFFRWDTDSIFLKQKEESMWYPVCSGKIVLKETHTEVVILSELRYSVKLLYALIVGGISVFWILYMFGQLIRHETLPNSFYLLLLMLAIALILRVLMIPYLILITRDAESYLQQLINGKGYPS